MFSKTIQLGLLFLLCIVLPHLFKLMEGMNYTTTEMDSLEKKTDETSLVGDAYNHPQNNDPDKGQVVSRFQSHAKEDPNAPKRQLFSRE